MADLHDNFGMLGQFEEERFERANQGQGDQGQFTSLEFVNSNYDYDFFNSE